MPSSGVQTCALDRKSTRLNSSHTIISYAVFCLKKITASSPRFAAPRGPRRALWRAGTARRARGRPLVEVFVPQRWHLDLVLGGLLFFFNDAATTEIYTLSLHDALPI